MTQEQQSKLLGEFYAEKKNILKLKGEDYANEDVLSNFKSAGANIGISAELQCLSLIATKVARLGNLLSGKTPNNESISDSILYLSNYTDLFYCLVNEKITDDLKSVKENILKKQQDIVRDFEMKPNNLLDEKYSLHEPKTKRWENVEPFNPPSQGLRPMNEYGLDVYRDVVGSPLKKCSDTADKIEEELRKLEIAKKFHDELLNEVNKLSKITDELNNPKTECDCTEPMEYKPTPEPTNPNKETYHPKVGDRFRTPFGEYFNVIYVGGTHCILSRVCGSLTQEFKIFHDEMHEYIKSGILRKD